MTWSEPVKLEEDELPAGTKLDGRYRVRSLLGEGGMGVVYLAEDLERGHDIALKILIPRYRGRPEREQRLLNEAKLARFIGEHPNLPRLFDSGRLHDLDGCPYVAWEVVQGLDLNALLALRHTIQPRVAVRWSRQLADALCVMHRAGVVHRDVTVTNVFIESPDDDPRVKLIDLSHSARLPRSDVSYGRITRELEIPGAHRFMPPEQAMGAPPHPKMDVFSFGVVLYEMLTGRNPFRHVPHRDAYIELQRTGQLQVARIDRRVYPNVPESLVELVVACTHNEVDRRLEMTEVLRRLDELLPQMSRPVLVPADELPPDTGDDVVDSEIGTGPTGRTIAHDEIAEAVTEPVERRGAALAAATAEPGPGAAPIGPPKSPRTVDLRRGLPIVVLVAMAVLALTATAVFFLWSGSEEPATSEPAPPAAAETSPKAADGRSALPRAEPITPEDRHPEPSPPAEPVIDEATPTRPEHSAGVDEPEPEKDGNERERARPAKPAPHETEACRRAVADALSADASHAWVRLESLTRKRKCFEDRRRWSELRVRALLETGRLDECAALANKFKNDVVQKYAGICRAQKGTP